MKAIDKYLANYSEPETQLAEDIPLEAITHCLVIPAYDEEIDFFTRLNTLLQDTPVLLIVVINQPDSVLSNSPTNSELLSSLVNLTRPLWQNQHLHLRQIPTSLSKLLIIDRFQHERRIPHKQGVGLARKIGADIAALLIRQGKITTPWIFSSDADATLPESYFSHTPTDHHIAAMLFPFIHKTGDNLLGLATRLYAFSLEYYRAGLDFAESPYAFNTLGSILSFSATAYCQVRGFPKRSGGEDFYLLNKLAKTGTIKTLETPLITLDARESHRVPFGTGPAVEALIKQARNQNIPGESNALQENRLRQHFNLYNPEIFIHLKHLLAAFPGCFQQSPDTLLKGLPDEVQPILIAMGINQAINNANRLTQRAGTQTDFLRHMHGWFDGFRTLKFVHGLRSRGLVNVLAKDLTTQQAPWIKTIDF